MRQKLEHGPILSPNDNSAFNDILCDQKGSVSRMFQRVNVESSDIVATAKCGTSKLNATMGYKVIRREI